MATTATNTNSSLGKQLQPLVVQRFLGEDSLENPFLPMLGKPHVLLLFAPGPQGIRKQMKHLVQGLMTEGIISSLTEVNQRTWVWTPQRDSPLIPIDLGKTDDTKPPSLLVHLVYLLEEKVFSPELIKLVHTATALELIGCSTKVIRK